MVGVCHTQCVIMFTACLCTKFHMPVSRSSLGYRRQNERYKTLCTLPMLPFYVFRKISIRKRNNFLVYSVIHNLVILKCISLMLLLPHKIDRPPCYLVELQWHDIHTQFR